jgi:hypothetical protein
MPILEASRSIIITSYLAIRTSFQRSSGARCFAASATFEAGAESNLNHARNLDNKATYVAIKLERYEVDRIFAHPSEVGKPTCEIFRPKTRLNHPFEFRYHLNAIRHFTIHPSECRRAAHGQGSG